MTCTQIHKRGTTESYREDSTVVKLEVVMGTEQPVCTGESLRGYFYWQSNHHYGCPASVPSAADSKWSTSKSDKTPQVTHRSQVCVCHLGGQLSGDRVLQAAQHEGPQHLVQPVSHQQSLLFTKQG